MTADRAIGALRLARRLGWRPRVAMRERLVRWFARGHWLRTTEGRWVRLGRS